MNKRIVYLCRGAGYGHAAHALQILQHLQHLVPPQSIEVASAGTGYQYFIEHSYPCVNLEIDDGDDHSAAAMWTVLKYLCARHSSELVISDEFFFVPRMSRSLGLRSIFITHAFSSEFGDPEPDRMVEHADQIILLDWKSIHQIPPALSPRLKCVGPLARSINVTRHRARTELGLTSAQFVAVAAFGAMTEWKRPHIVTCLDAILAAWSQRQEGGRLFLILGGDAESGLSGPTRDLQQLTLVSNTPKPDAYYRAADVVFTLGGATMLELLQAEIPIVAFSALDWELQRLRYVENRARMRIANVDDSPQRIWQLVNQVLTSSHSTSELTFGDPRNVASIIHNALSSDLR